MTIMPIARLVQMFDWTSEDGKRSLTFTVTHMLDDIINRKLKAEYICSELDKDFVRQWIVKRDLNMIYVETMSKDYRNMPVLGVWMEDGSVLLIDGSHRYMRRYLDNCATVDYLIVALDDWKPYAKETRN